MNNFIDMPLTTIKTSVKTMPASQQKLTPKKNTSENGEMNKERCLKNISNLKN